jgi:hypothetical protein
MKLQPIYLVSIWNLLSNLDLFYFFKPLTAFAVSGLFVLLFRASPLSLENNSIIMNGVFQLMLTNLLKLLI